MWPAQKRRMHFTILRRKNRAVEISGSKDKARYDDAWDCCWGGGWIGVRELYFYHLCFFFCTLLFLVCNKSLNKKSIKKDKATLLVPGSLYSTARQHTVIPR